MSQTEQTPETRRLTASEIFEAAADSARSELKRPWRALAISGLAGGMTMGLTAIAVSAVLGNGGWQDLIAYMSSRPRAPKADERGTLRSVCIGTDVNKTTHAAWVIPDASMPPHPPRKVPLLRSFGPQVRDDTCF